MFIVYLFCPAGKNLEEKIGKYLSAAGESGL
jgi:hypothetical protein